MSEVMLSILCKQGKLVITERSVQVVAPFNRVVWNVQRTAIVGVSVDRGIMSNTVVFQAGGRAYKAETIAKHKTNEILALFN